VIESKSFYRRIEAAFAGLRETHSELGFAELVAPRLLHHLAQPLAIGAVQVYERRGGRLTQAVTCGAKSPDLSGELMERFAPIGAEAIRELPWVGETRAGRSGLLNAGDAEESPLLALILAPPGALRGAPSRSELLSALTSLRYAILQHQHRRELEDLFEQARAVQQSLLPPSKPQFADYDICAVSVPAQSVGGDFYDFIPIDRETMALTVADASGHGLPAALQARDVATGLRMGAERDFKVTRMIERLNRVIHRSGLSTKFVSLVFGELEKNGNFWYVNAGHPTPLLIDDKGVHELTVGGMILGPDPDTLYKLGFAHLDRGATMVLYSDGVVERAIEREREFGTAGLSRWLTDWREGPAEAAIHDLLVRLRKQDDGTPFEDDVTAMMVRRPR
jgi:sigma-B regulation protein RsbU (phosphoserine phosphatase)